MKNFIKIWNVIIAALIKNNITNLQCYKCQNKTIKITFFILRISSYYNFCRILQKYSSVVLSSEVTEDAAYCRKWNFCTSSALFYFLS